MPTNQNNVPTYHSAFLKVWFYFFFYSHYKIQIKHFDFAFRGFKFLETEGSNFCGEGSFTPLLPHNHKIMQKKIKSLRSHPMCRKPFISAVYPIFCSFPLYQLSEFYFRADPQRPARECSPGQGLRCGSILGRNTSRASIEQAGLGIFFLACVQFFVFLPAIHAFPISPHCRRASSPVTFEKYPCYSWVTVQKPELDCGALLVRVCSSNSAWLYFSTLVNVPFPEASGWAKSRTV